MAPWRGIARDGRGEYRFQVCDVPGFSVDCVGQMGQAMWIVRDLARFAADSLCQAPLGRHSPRPIRPIVLVLCYFTKSE